MNVKDISTKNEIKQKESSSDEQIDSPSASYYINKFQKILLDIDEKPDTIIEKILINIFNRYISPDINENENFDFYICQKKIKMLSLKHEKYQIIYYLLTKIRSLIKKYREKIFELPTVIELQEKMKQRYYPRSFSFNKKNSDEYIDFSTDRPLLRHKSYPKMKKIFDYYTTVKNLFCELKNIKNCLEKTAPIIERIFEIPLSEFEKFSIYECEKEDYLKILIHDSFIWNEIVKNKNTHLYDIIEEITEDENINLNEMTNKIEYFKKIHECKRINIDEMLKISKIGSSIDSRYPEDAKPIDEIRYKIKEYYDNSTTEITNEEIEVDQYSNSNTDELNIQKNETINNINSINNINNLDDITIFNKIKESIIVNNRTKEINTKIITNNPINKINSINNITNITNINTINIKEDTIIKNNSDISNNKEKFEKKIIINNKIIHNEMNNIIDKNINIANFEKNKIKMLKKKEKFFKNKKDLKKENNNDKNKYKSTQKIDKKDIPSDIDDLVKYIVNDDKTETQNKKKKKNKKKNRRNKTEIRKEIKEETINQEDKKEKEENDEIKEIKDNIIKNSINRYNIHKIKFKYRPKWLKKISNYP